MKKLQFKKEIKASSQKVYETMLGLKDKSTYEFWTSAFNPTSTFEGSWEIGRA
ncbi:MAG TPA: tungsten formylmethanofuran dehydrogenase, partial [Flavobacteriales bacterium]|nr:tungsten formylmethanofuran dehydrogenase [Flavobacteriales bacterium]